MKLSNVPPRAVTGGYILHSGIAKWKGDEQIATRTHGAAAGAYPFLASIPPKTFLRVLAAGEVGLGAALLAPFVSDRLAGAALTGFSAALVGLYARTPGMREPGSVWPSPQGVAVSKDVWMLGIGLGLAVDG